MNLSQELRNQAKDLAETSPEYVAVGILKQAGINESDARRQILQSLMEKSAIEHLITGGVAADQAALLVKAAGVEIPKDSFKAEVSVQEHCAGLLLKAAEQVEALEARVSELEKEAVDSSSEKPEYIQKLASSGAFTKEDLAALMALPADTLTKVASAAEEPWSMGAGAGTSKESLDPMAAWLLG